MIKPANISLRLRLLTAAAIAIVLALVISGSVLSKLFADHVDAREWSELRNHLNQLIGAIERERDDQIAVGSALADPRFDQPRGGLYWQIDVDGGKRLRSRSLWDTVLQPPSDELQPGDVHRHRLDGPDGAPVMAIETAVTIPPESAPLRLRIMVAVDRREVDVAIASFRSVLFQSLAVLGICLLSALVWQIRIGLGPLRRLHRELLAVRQGQASRIDGAFATELAPIVDDLNALLARERQEREYARERAADLAHGFKTPLAIQATIARDLRRRGELQAADELDAQIALMSRHVSSELSRARTAGAMAVGRAEIPVLPIVEQVVKALSRIGADRRLSWTIDVEPPATFQGDENDLLEMVGNLADNATKWAKSRIAIRAAADGGVLRIVVEDDGPGVPLEAEQLVMQRGARLDEQADGHGLGMSIVAKIVERYGGSVALDQSPMGGLAVRVSVPRAA